MKKITTFLLIIFFAYQAYAQIEVYDRYTPDNKLDPEINIFGEKELSDKFKLTVFTVLEPHWAQGLIGIAYAPVEWVNFEVSGGIEYHPAWYRLGGKISFIKDKLSLVTIAEKGDGHDNYFYKSTLLYKFSEKFKLGARIWRDHGIGPVGMYTIVKRSGLDVWLMPSYDLEHDTGRLIFGVSVKI